MRDLPVALDVVLVSPRGQRIYGFAGPFPTDGPLGVKAGARVVPLTADQVAALNRGDLVAIGHA